MPPFSRDEIAAFLIARGCSPNSLASQWATLIELHTQGHAQLVHARVAALESAGFPRPSAQDLTKTPPEVIEARAEARRLLELLDPSARELVCRLSLGILAMQRRQVISIATQAPAVSDPGLAFDKLIGPWVETLSEDLYRISPLVRDAGVEIQGAAWAKRAHRAIARGLLVLRTLTPSDFSSILLHSIAAEDWGVIGQLSMGTFSADTDTWSALAELAGWFVLVGTGEEVSAPNADPFTLFLIRLLQYRLAVAGGNDDASLAIITRFNQELPSGQIEQPLQLCRQFFLAQILTGTEIPLTVTEIVNVGTEYVNLSDALSGILSEAFHDIPEHTLQGPDRSFDTASVAGFALSNRVNDRPGMKELLDACEPLAVPVARRLLWFIGGTEAVASLLFARSWLWESRQQPPDWDAARAVCLRAYRLARHWELPGLAHAAARAAAQIVDEHLGGREEALRLADQLAAEIGWSPSQEDGRAAILLRNGDFAGALEIWRRILPGWKAQSEFDLQQQFSCRDAAIAAARLDNWSEAGDWLAEARERTGVGANPIYEAALLIDEGYARWKSGDPASALGRLTDDLQAIERLPSDEADEQAYLLRKRAGHTVMWMAGTAEKSPPKGFSAPPPACCSRLDPLSGPRVPSTPSDMTWAHLLDFEYAEQLGDNLLRAHEAQLAKSPFGLVRVTIGMLRIRDRLRTLAISDLVQLAGELVEATELCRVFYKEEGHDGADPLPATIPVPDRANLPRDLIFGVMISGIFALAARGAFTEQVTGRWQAGAAEARLSGMIDPWLELVRGLFVTEAVNATKIAHDASQGWERHIVASIKIGIDNTSRPRDFLTVHGYWAQQLPPLQLSFFPVDDVEYLVTEGWRRLSERPFLLRMPATTVPALTGALASTAIGWRKVGEVLVAAENATPWIAPEQMRQAIRKLVAD